MREVSADATTAKNNDFHTLPPIDLKDRLCYIRWYDLTVLHYSINDKDVYERL